MNVKIEVVKTVWYDTNVEVTEEEYNRMLDDDNYAETFIGNGDIVDDRIEEVNVYS